MNRRNFIKSLVFFAAAPLSAAVFKKQRVNVRALSATRFEVIDTKSDTPPHVVDLKGKKFIVVCVLEPGSDGAVYAVDVDGTIWWHSKIATGAPGDETTNGIHHVLLKRRYHMSRTHPNPTGVDNMDFELQFTEDGQALHLGNIHYYSHGCVHVPRQDIAAMFKWATVGTTVVVMRGHYRHFLVKEVDRFENDLHNYDMMRQVKNLY